MRTGEANRQILRRTRAPRFPVVSWRWRAGKAFVAAIVPRSVLDAAERIPLLDRQMRWQDITCRRSYNVSVSLY